ncbi:MAG: hypothetical protein EBS01_11400, partial [Verrucomicrobia bacterium]|nr:hypothetical protein [Verrucomicrobiota bacterium]
MVPADAEEVLHDLIVRRRIDLPCEFPVGEPLAAEPSLGSVRQHAIARDDRTGPRPAVVAERVDVSALVPGLPERPTGLRMETPQPHPRPDAIEDEKAAERRRRRAVALPHLGMPHDPRARLRPGHR